MDGFLMFPWLAPHVHFNVFLNGAHVDPFAIPGTDEVSLWRGGGDPLPPDGDHERDTSGVEFQPSAWDKRGIAQTVAACRKPALRRRLQGIDDIDRLAAELLYQTAYYPTRFSERFPLYAEEHARRPLLSLPFSADDFVGVCY